MTTIAVALVKDEADIIEGTLRHMASQVDHLIVADNLSTDGTTEILYRLADVLPLEVLHDEERAYYQSAKTSALATAAADAGAEWVVAFDADEVWFADGGRIADVLAGLPPEVGVARAALWNHYATALDDAAEEDPFRRMGWRDPQSVPLPKVAFRYEPGAVVWQGNHGVTLPSSPLTAVGRLSARHFPMRSPAQVLSKICNGAAAYAATDLPESEGAHWRSMGRLLDTEGDGGVDGIWSHWFYEDPVGAGLVFDPVSAGY